jgi:hypothetical protein
VARVVFLDEPPYDIAAWLERRRALGQDLFDEVWRGEYHVAPARHRRHGDVSYFAHGVEEVLIVDPQRRTVEWYARGADAFARSGRSALLDVDEPTLHAEIDWPPT